MRNTIALFWITVLCAGCIYVQRPTHPPHHPPPPPSPPPVVVTDPQDSVALAEIDAAGRLDFEASRMHALQTIARRPSLSPPVQVHLVNVVYARLDFEASKLNLLQSIIQNPSFSNAAKQAILTQVNKLTFDSSRMKVLDDLNRRGAPEH